MSKELLEAVKLFITQPLNNPLSRGQMMEVARIALPMLAQQERACQKCNGTGEMDSGGTQPWGEQILIECDCKFEQQERGEGWIEWGGGECPVDGPVMVEVKHRDRLCPTTTTRADDLDWNHYGYKFGPDIIAYRIIPEQPTNQNGEQ